MSLNSPLVDWQGRTVWLVGASSGIGLALGHRLARLGARVAVSARQAAPLEAFAAAHAGALALPLDVTDRAAVATAAQVVAQHFGPLDLVVYCAGTYTPVRADAFDLDVMLRHQQVNYVGALHLLDAVLPALVAQADEHTGRAPHLSLIASVAGYRGLPHALAYGPTKAALIHLAEALYLDLHARGVGVSVINPGFVDTPLTAQNRFAMPAMITVEQAAQAIVDGWARGRFEIHFPRRFTNLLRLMKHLPDWLYFALVRRATTP